MQRKPQLSEARTLFRRFHCFAPSRLIRHSCCRMLPKVMVDLGRLRGLIYTSDRGQPLKTYIHFFEKPAHLTCNPEGTHLYILGGNYRVTERGIEG